MGEVDHLAEPRAYLFSVQRSLVQQQVRRRQVVAIETMAELDGLGAEAPQASPERVASSREQLALAQRLLSEPPARCRQAFRLRRTDGLSPREAAGRLRIRESTVGTQPPLALPTAPRGVEGLSQGEVAERLRISESTVEKHMIRALRLMMAGIGDADAPAPGQSPGAGVRGEAGDRAGGAHGEG